MTAIFPQLADCRIDYAWGGTLGITVRRMPHIAQVSERVLSASGYSGHGVALATHCGRLMADSICGESAEFDTLASVPCLPFPGGSRLRWPLLVTAMSWYALRDRLTHG